MQLRTNGARGSALAALLIHFAASDGLAEPRSLLLEELTWPEVQSALDEGYTRVLVAVGSTEQHGPAIALGSDSFQGETLGRRIAERLGRTLLAPVIRMGVAPHHMHFPGTITIREDVLVEVLLDHVRSLTAHGFDVLLLPTHGGNFGAVAETLARARDEALSARVLGFHDAASYLGAMRAVTNTLGVPKEIAGGHSGQQEASIVMAIDPERVRLADAAPGYTGDPDRLPPEASTIGYHAITENGAIGDPTGATAAKGRAYLDALAETVGSHFERELRAAEEDPVDGVWTYETISLSTGGRETLTGSFFFIDGLFVQSAIHDGPLETAIGQGHSGRYQTSGNQLELGVALQMVVDPKGDAVSYRDEATHAATWDIEGDRLTVTFPSGTVQVMRRVAENAEAPLAIYDIVGYGGYGEEKRPASGRFMIASGRFAYAAVVQSNDPALPSSFHSAEGTASPTSETTFALRARRSFRGRSVPSYAMNVDDTVDVGGDGRLVLRRAGETWHVEARH